MTTLMTTHNPERGDFAKQINEKSDKLNAHTWRIAQNIVLPTLQNTRDGEYLIPC